jgi:hypothetical protein
MAGGNNAARPARSRVGRVLVVGMLVAAAVVLIDAFLLADMTGISKLRPGVTLGFAVGLLVLATGMVAVPPAGLIGFGVLALGIGAMGVVAAPPQGIEWLAALGMLAFPVGLILWGVALRKRRRHSR